MTIRSTIRPYFEEMERITAIAMGITVLIILTAPAFIAFGIPAGISAWWNEKPVLSAIVQNTIIGFCYQALPKPKDTS